MVTTLVVRTESPVELLKNTDVWWSCTLIKIIKVWAKLFFFF